MVKVVLINPISLVFKDLFKPINFLSLLSESEWRKVALLFISYYLSFSVTTKKEVKLVIIGSSL